MPTRPLPPCRWPGCSRRQEPGGGGYCREHQWAKWRRDNRERGTARQRGYTKAYEEARAWVLSRHPLCAVCELEGRMTPAEVTHHIVPLSQGGSNRADNLLPVCRACHDRLHSKDGADLLRRVTEGRRGPDAPVVV